MSKGGGVNENLTRIKGYQPFVIYETRLERGAIGTKLTLEGPLTRMRTLVSR